MRILTIDPSTHVGWAFFAPDLKRPIFGSKDFSAFAGVDGRVHSHFLRWLREHVGNARPDVIVIESPFFRGGNSEFLYGFFNLAALVAFEGFMFGKHSIQLEKIHLAHAKKHFTGRGNATKEEMIQAARNLGYHVQNDHEADALAILHFKMTHTADHIVSQAKTVSLKPRALNTLTRKRKGIA